MGVGITSTFSMADVMARLQSAQKRINTAVGLRLSYLGEECVNRARAIAPEIGFTDQTGALRGSIGYAVYHNGIPFKVGKFDSVNGNSDGPKQGKDLAAKVAAENSQGWVVVIVAGMNYAVKLENRGRDVLSSTEHYAESEVISVLSMLKSKIAKMKV